MKDLYLAIYVEGKTDEQFFRPLIERIVLKIVLSSKNGEAVEVRHIHRVEPEKSGDRAKDILEAAKMARDYPILIVHMDADTQTHDDVKATRLEPGTDLIAQQPPSEKACRHVVPLIPVKMTEAWMLADWQTVLEELNANDKLPLLRADLKKAGLPLPSKPHQVTAIDNPKQTLDQIIRIVSGRRESRRPDITRNDLYEPLGESVRLEVLSKLDAYTRFEEDLKKVLVELHKIDV